MITMLLGGLWHGASWNFVIWGGLHGAFLAAERFAKSRWDWANSESSSLLKRIALVLLTFLAINITWVFFRASDFSTASELVSSMFGFAPDDAKTPLPFLYIIQVSIVTIGLLVAHWFMRDKTLEQMVENLPRWVITIALIFMTFCILITQGKDNAFIYFQF